MRIALAALLLAGLGGCIIDPPDNGGDYPSGGGDGWGSGWGGSGGGGGYGCHSDSACGTGYVCARNGECASASAVRIVHTLWTVKDQLASDVTCTAARSLDITFESQSGEMFGFAPVPCDAGKYTIDKMPMRFTRVTLARAGDYNGGDTGTFDAEGNASLDLPY